MGTVLVKRLPNHASIFSAEAKAILLALDIVNQSSDNNILILSDSLSCIKSIENRNLKNPLILEIVERLHQLQNLGHSITFVWVPSHIGIAGNTAADATAKAALCLQISNSQIPHTDFKPLISSYVNSCWQQCWNTENNNKLHAIQPTIKPVVLVRLPRRDEVLIHRLRVGHTYLTHSYLLHRERPPECDACRLPLTVEHILISCSKYNSVRQTHFTVSSLEELFHKVNVRVLIQYIKEIGLYSKI